MSLRRNVVANFMAQAWVGVMSLAFVPVYVGYLGIESYGVIGLVAAIQAWLVLLDMGITPTITREMARFGSGARSAQSIVDLFRSLEIVGWIVSILILIGMLAGAGVLAHSWVRSEGLSPKVILHALQTAGLLVSVRFIESVYRGAVLGAQRQVWSSVVVAAMATFRALGAIAVLEWVQNTIIAFLAWQALLAVILVLLYAWKARSLLPASPESPKFSWNELSGVRGFAGGMVALTVTSLMMSQVDKILLSRLLTLESFGYYTLASAVALALMMLANPINTAAYPRLVAAVGINQAPAQASLFHAVSQLTTVALGPAALLLAFHAEGLLYLWSGDTSLAERTAPLLTILAIGTLLNTFTYPLYYLQLAHGWTSLALRFNVVAITLTLPTLWLLVPRFGGIASAWVLVVLNAGQLTILAPFVIRRLIPGEFSRWVTTDLANPLAALLTVLILALPLRPETYGSRWEWLFFLLPTLLLAWAAAAACAPSVRAGVRSVLATVRL